MSEIPMTYRASKKAWMTNPIFNEYLIILNSIMKAKDQNILLFMDNAPVHIIDADTMAKLTNVKVVFFPPNQTCVLQPLDGGIIRSFKARSRKYSPIKLLNIIDNGNGEHTSVLVKKFHVLDAIRFIVQSWSEVSTATICSCFSNSGFTFPQDHELRKEHEFDASDDYIEQDLAKFLRELDLEGEEPVFEESIECYDPVVEEDMVDYVVNECNDDN